MKPVQLKSFYCRFADTRHYGDDWTHVEEVDADDAAEAFARQSDEEGDYDIVKRGNVDCQVEVRAPDGVVSRWEISAEVRNHYYAEEAASADAE